MAPECPLWGAFLSAEGTCGDLVRKHLQGQENSVLLPVARPGLPPRPAGLTLGSGGLGPSPGLRLC